MTAATLDVMQIKRRLRRLRALRGVSQIAAAEGAGISASVLEKYESINNARIPNTRQLFALAQFYGASIDYILMGDARPSTDS